MIKSINIKNKFGCSVGWYVGTLDGDIVGCSVGCSVGISEGNFVGIKDGKDELVGE